MGIFSFHVWADNLVDGQLRLGLEAVGQLEKSIELLLLGWRSRGLSNLSSIRLMRLGSPQHTALSRKDTVT